jgi:polyhydroxyalkanoate synthesis regulator phasin
MSNIIEKSFLLGLGALTMTREKVAAAVEDLVSTGEVEVEESRKLVDRLVAKGEEEREALRKMIHQEVEKARSAAPVSRQEVEKLNDRVEQLAIQVGELMAQAEDETEEEESES